MSNNLKEFFIRCPEQAEEVVTHMNTHLIRVLVCLKEHCDEKLGGRYPQITSIYRTIPEQEEIYDSIVAKSPSYSGPRLSPHCFGNAIDLSVYDQHGICLSDRDLSRIVQYLNTAFRYSANKPTAYRHHGTGDHIHVQVNYKKWGVGYEPQEANI